MRIPSIEGGLDKAVAGLGRRIDSLLPIGYVTVMFYRSSITSCHCRIPVSPSRKTRLFCCLLLLLGGPCSLVAQQTVTIDATAPRQTFEGWGTSLAWFANGAGGWKEQNRERLAATLFNQQTGLGLTYVRFNIGGGDNPHNPNPISGAQRAMPGYEPSPGQFDWTADANQRWFLKKALSLGVNLTEAIAYSPPYWMTISGTSQGAVGGGSNLQKKYFGHGSGTFVNYLTTVVAHYRDAWGITFRTLDPLNEPAPLWWKAGDRKQEGCHFSQEEQDRLIRDTGLSLASKGLLTTVSAPDENSINKAVEEFRDYTARAKAQIAQINTHGYAGTQRAELRTLAESNGKRLTMSEWGTGGAVSGEKLAREIQADITDMGVVAWSIWQPVWPTLMKIDYARQTFELTPIYFVYENYTRFIRPGYQFFTADDSSTLAAFDANAGKLTIVKQNWTDSVADVHFELSNFTLDQASVVSYRSVGTEPLLATAPVRVTASGFTVSIPAQSVVTYVISGVSIREPSLKLLAAGPTKTRKAFHFTGRWQSSPAMGGNDELFSARANDFYTISFVGRHARIYGPLGPTEGFAAFSVDGGGETDVDLYSGKSRDDAMLFSTPLLASGPHTVTVRVTGLKNPAAGGYAVPAKYAEMAASLATASPPAIK